MGFSSQLGKAALLLPSMLIGCSSDDNPLPLPPPKKPDIKKVSKAAGDPKPPSRKEQRAMALPLSNPESSGLDPFILGDVEPALEEHAPRFQNYVNPDHTGININLSDVIGGADDEGELPWDDYFFDDGLIGPLRRILPDELDEPIEDDRPLA